MAATDLLDSFLALPLVTVELAASVTAMDLLDTFRPVPPVSDVEAAGLLVPAWTGAGPGAGAVSG